MAQRLNSLLSGAQELRPLLDRVQTLSALQQHIICVAPPQLVQSLQVLGLQLGTLSIAVANSTIAAKLRHLAPELVVKLQSRGCEVSGIRVKVQVSFDRNPSRSRPRTLSVTAQNALNEFSLGLDNSPLKATLSRMTKNKG